MDSVPDQDGVGQQAEAARLIHDLLVIAGAEGAVVGEEQPLGQGMAEFTAIELKLDCPAKWFLIDIAEDVDGLAEAPQGDQRLGDAIGWAGISDPLQDDMRWRQPIFE